MRIVRQPRYPRQHVHRFGRQHDGPRPRLAVFHSQLAGRQVHPVPAKVQDLALAAPGEESGHETWARPIGTLMTVFFKLSACSSFLNPYRAWKTPRIRSGEIEI